MKKSILFVPMLAISMLVWNCGGGSSSKKKLTDSQKTASGLFGVNPADYESALNGDKDAALTVLTKVFTRPTSQNGIGMIESEVTNILKGANETARDNAFTSFAKKVAAYLFIEQPANFKGQPNKRLAANNTDAENWLRGAFTPKSVGIMPNSEDHYKAFERLFGDDGGKVKNGAIHSHDDAATKLPAYSMFILMTLLSVMDLLDKDYLEAVITHFGLDEYEF